LKGSPALFWGRRRVQLEQPTLYSADLRACTAIGALSQETVTTAFVRALEHAGATIVQRVSHTFPDAGITCVLILGESHATLHTWPETGAVSIDIFTSSTSLDSRAAIEELGRSFGADGMSVQETLRADGHVPSFDPRR
jgi:S-adenosylmethionine decarboxylase